MLSNKEELKILIISPYEIGAGTDNAGGMHIINIAEGLSKKGHAVDVLDLSSNGKDGRFCGFNVIKKMVNKRFLHFVGYSYMPKIILRYIVKGLFRRLNIGKYDICQIEYSFIGWIGIGLKSCDRQGRPVVVIDFHDVGYSPIINKARHAKNPINKILLIIRSIILKVNEKRTIKEVGHVIVKSKIDREKVLCLGAKNDNIVVIPCGTKIISQAGKMMVPRNIMFVGKIDRYENIVGLKWFLEKVWSKIEVIYKSSKMVIVGKASDKAKKQLGGIDRVEITGWLADAELDRLYAALPIVIAPIFIGGGQVVKIVEAMGHGCPVISTKIGNEGIGAEDGKEIIIAEKPDEFIDAISQLMNNNEYSAMISANAKRFIADNYLWSNILDKLEQAFYGITTKA